MSIKLMPFFMKYGDHFVTW